MAVLKMAQLKNSLKIKWLRVDDELIVSFAMKNSQKVTHNEH